MNTLKRHSLFVLALGLFFSMLLPSFTSTVEAAPVTGFKAGRIMDDGVFTNKRSMSASQIQSFLNSKVPNCDTNGTKPSEYGGGTRAQYGRSRGYPPPYICLRNYSQGGKSAAQIIYDTAQRYNISPKVLIVLLQKEQGLVTDTWPWSIQYRSATGYGCPDTAACDSEYYGFTNQVRWSAIMFDAIMRNSPNWYTPYSLGNNRIYWHPDTGRCGSSTVNIENRATVALYSYTPYRPNSAALNAGYGTGNSCSSYGNRNFYQYYKDWFGNPVKLNNVRLIECGGNKYLVERGRRMKRRITNTGLAAWNLENKTFTGGDSGCSYPTYDAILSRLIRSRTTGKMYLVDKGVSYHVRNQSIANAWKLGSLSQAAPQFDGDSINDNLSVKSILPRLVTSDNMERSDYYLIDSGNRHTIAGTPSGDTTALQLVRGYKEVPAARLSVDLITTLESQPSINYSFKIGADQYLLNHNETRKVSSSTRPIWQEFLSGPTLSSNILSVFGRNTTISNGFNRNNAYYKVLAGEQLEKTNNKSVAENWVSGGSPRITQLLTNKILGDIPVTTTRQSSTGNIRLIKCGNTNYLVERFVRRKRVITNEGVQAWGFNDEYYFINDRGCSYPSYDKKAEGIIRSRNTGKVYYLDDRKAYYVHSQTAANAWSLGNTATAVYPQFNPRSILDNLTVERELPPPPLP